MADVRMKYPVGIQSFETIINGKFAYVDKTAYVYELAQGEMNYFLSRPRRFGKSLLISALKAYFLGRKELFEGLAIADLEKEWTEYPVLHLDFNTKNYKTEADLNERIDKTLSQWEETYGCKYEGSPELRFENIIINAHKKTGKKVVVLVDEYDKPLLQTLNNKELHNDYRGTLKAFYGNLKSQGDHIKFSFITGVTRFSKVSIFSDLNNLNDISISERFAGICGITESELHQYFEPSIRQMAQKNKMDYEEMCQQLKEQYDGYRFSQEESEGIYNPFSLVNAFYNMRLNAYWFESGTPTFLVQQLEKNNYDLRQLQGEKLADRTLRESDSLLDNPVSLLFQTGYLTIKEYNDRFKTYKVGFPNKEVELGFLQCLLPYYTPKKNEDSFAFIGNFVEEVEAGQPEAFLQRMKTLLDGGDYRVAGEAEKYFQNVVFLIFRLMGFFTNVERASSQGRSDVVVETPDYIYVIEMKLDGTPEEALQQIEDNGYALPYAKDKRKLYKIGVNFSSKTRSIEKWEIRA